MNWQRGAEEEEVVVMEEEKREEEEEEKEGNDGVVRWERFLPRVSLRVLLVEGDDSTRQIIAALLRKCDYKVVAVSDGLKAWETLKEKPHSIDLVLVEVELPSISGFSFLTMTMDHETCKNIPVIMMSSHDSISMVYKCMVKGAADFLVKPIRKNELRNLWQHVWRRHSLSGGHDGTNVHQDENLAKRKLEANCEKGNQLSESVPSVPNNEDCSDKGSDAQSSCTRSDMEAESTYKRNTLELKQPMCRGFSLFNGTIGQDGEEQIQLDSSLLVHEGEAEDKSVMLGSEVIPLNRTCISNEQFLEEERSCAPVETTNEVAKPTGTIDNNNVTNETDDQNCDQNMQTDDQNCDPDRPLKEVIDLIGVIDNQPQCSYALRDNTAIQSIIANAPEVVFHNKDVRCNSSSMPLLELSLRRYQHSYYDKEENNEWNTLNHSDSSAFSLYNSRTAVRTLLSPMNFHAEGEECYSTSTKPIPDQGSGNSSNAPRWNGTVRNLNTEDVKSPCVGFPSQDGIAVKCSPLRVIPFPIPDRGMNFDSLSAGYGTVMQPIFYPQSSALPLWSTIPSMWKEAIHMNSSHQSDLEDLNSSESHHPHMQSPKSPILHSAQMEEVNMELRDEQRRVSSVTGDSGSTSIFNGSTSHLNSRGSVCSKSNGNISAANISNATAEIGNEERKKSTDLHRLNLREAALNKFRLKRKDRCFEKKVRYQSRKRLAEQRPRVKGQFVRHVQPDPPSMEAVVIASI